MSTGALTCHQLPGCLNIDVREIIGSFPFAWCAKNRLGYQTSNCLSFARNRDMRLFESTGSLSFYSK